MSDLYRGVGSVRAQAKNRSMLFLAMTILSKTGQLLHDVAWSIKATLEANERLDDSGISETLLSLKARAP